jgi:hypothetical protein
MLLITRARRGPNLTRQDQDFEVWKASIVSRKTRQRGAVLTLVAIAVLIAGFVYLLVQPRWTERTIAEVNGAIGSSQLEVTVNHNECGNGGPRVRVTEQSDDAVMLRAEQNERGDCVDIGLTSVITVELDAPLGERAILFDPDEQSGSVVCTIDGATTESCS